MNKPFPIFATELSKELPIFRPSAFITEKKPIAAIKLLVVVDETIADLRKIEQALQLQNNDYLAGTDGELEVRHEIVRANLSGLPWSDYWGNNYGVNWWWIEQETQKRVGVGAYSIAYVIDDSNWTRQGNQNIWGWHTGKHNGFQVQLIRYGEQNSVDWPYKTFLMELAHSWDNLYERVISKQIEELFGVADFDEDIIHGRANPPWVVFQYVPVFKVLKQFLTNYFRIKKMKYIILSDKNQYLLYEEYKLAFAIADEIELKLLFGRGLVGSPEPVDNLDGYIIYPLINQDRLRDIFNIKN